MLSRWESRVWAKRALQVTLGDWQEASLRRDRWAVLGRSHCAKTWARSFLGSRMTQTAAQTDTFSCEPAVGCGLLVPGPPFNPVRSNFRVPRWWNSCAFWCVCGHCAFEKNSKVVHFSILLLSWSCVSVCLWNMFSARLVPICQLWLL